VQAVARHASDLDGDGLRRARHECRGAARRLSPATRLIASVKANAYGHGIIEVARHFAERAIDSLATGSFGAALAVREAGIDADIIMLGATLAEGMPQLLAHGFKPTLHTLELPRTPARRDHKRAWRRRRRLHQPKRHRSGKASVLATC
jgi:alanine racemase